MQLTKSKRVFFKDEDIYEILYHDTFKRQGKSVSKVKVSTEFEHLFKEFYLFNLRSKDGKKTDPNLVAKYGLSVVRNQNILIGVIVTSPEILKPVAQSVSNLSTSESVAMPPRPSTLRDPRLNRFKSTPVKADNYESTVKNSEFQIENCVPTLELECDTNDSDVKIVPIYSNSNSPQEDFYKFQTNHKETVDETPEKIESKYMFL
jgi:hypothetical protein